MAKGEVSVTGVESPEFLAPGWSLTNTVSPSAAGLSSEGYGDLSVDASPDVDDEFLIDREATVDLSKDLPALDTNEDVSLGTVNGWVSGYSTYGSVEDELKPSSRGPASLTITPTLAILNAERAAPAVVNVSLSEAFQTYVNHVSSTLTVTYQATENPVVSFPGWTGNVWEYISNLAAIKGVELSYTGQGLVVRDMQVTELDQEFTGDPSYRLEVNSAGQYVEVTYQDQQVITSVEENLVNYSQNPKLGVNTDHWESLVGTGERSATTPGGAAPWGGLTSFLSGGYGDPFTPYRIISEVVHHITVPPSLGGSPVSVGVWCRATSRDTSLPITWVQSPVEASLQITWYDALDNLLLDESFNAPSSTTVSFIVTTVSPINAVRAELFLRGKYGVGLAVAGRFYSSGAFLTHGVGASYFDGDSPGASWTGTPENSTSERPNPNNIPLYDAFLDNNRIMEVAAGAVESYVLESNVWATSLIQPIPVGTAPVGVGYYHVIDSQGVPCTGTFVGLGGEVTVSINELGQIVATLTGPTSEASINGGPYRLASYDGATTRGEFRLAGTGIITNQETVRVPTGADPERFSEDVAYSINYPFINTVDEAYTVGFATGAYANAAYPTVSFTFETDQMPSWDYAAGKWFDYNGSRFRIVSASVDSLTTQVTAPQRNTWGEVLDVHDSETYGDLNTVWAGLRYRDSLIKPRKDN